MTTTEIICEIVLTHYPKVQGIYLFGSCMSENEWSDSDIDIAILLPPVEAKQSPFLAMTSCARELSSALGKEVDLLNARTVSTVFQKEIVTKGQLLYCGDQFAVDEFEMLTISYYQKLNEERREIIETALTDGRFYKV